MNDAILTGGFSDPAIDAAKGFRAIMNAMARPGKIETLTGTQPPKGISVAAATVLCTLADHDTGIALFGLENEAEIRSWLTFHTNAPFVAAEDAHFALGPWEKLPIAQFPTGTPEYPDRSTTVIVEQSHLANTGSRLTGPGIKSEILLNLPPSDVFRSNAQLFPQGLDFILTCKDQVAALPRSSRVWAAEEA